MWSEVLNHIFVIVITVYRCVIKTCLWSEVLNDIFVITVYRCVIRTCMWSEVLNKDLSLSSLFTDVLLDLYWVLST